MTNGRPVEVMVDKHLYLLAIKLEEAIHNGNISCSSPKIKGELLEIIENYIRPYLRKQELVRLSAVPINMTGVENGLQN